MIASSDFSISHGNDGFWRIADSKSGECMHPLLEPFVEAQQVYAKQSKSVRDRSSSSVILWDVGLGAAANAMTIIRESESVITSPKTPIQIYSFECNLGGLELALQHTEKFPYLDHPAPRELLRSGYWCSPDESVSWKLFHGDFQTCQVRAPSPTVVFYDPFSSGTNPTMWSHTGFIRLYNTIADSASLLITYSTATPVRASLLAAGFFVGYGTGAGRRAESTIALSRSESLRDEVRLLGAEWLARWERSSRRYPLDLPESDHAEFEVTVRNHEQFK